MNVELVAWTQLPGGGGDPIDVAEMAASVCYDSKPTKSHAIVKSCIKSGHRSVIEHCSFTFHITGVSRALLAQLSRHRFCSLSVRSQRFCKENDFEYVSPVFASDDQRETFNALMDNDQIGYRLLKSLGMENEDARGVLPNACCTELYLTVNARALIEQSHLRLCTRAQKEIRDMYAAMRQCVEPVSPIVASFMVPSCEAHDVPFCEEAKCCGRHKKLTDIVKEDE